MSRADLPGLNRLLEVVRKHEMPAETLPAGQSLLRPGEALWGMPVDPQLASAIASVGRLVIGKTGAEVRLLLRSDDETRGFFKANKEWQGSFPHENWPDH